MNYRVKCKLQTSPGLPRPPFEGEERLVRSCIGFQYICWFTHLRSWVFENNLIYASMD